MTEAMLEDSEVKAAAIDAKSAGLGAPFVRYLRALCGC